MKKPLTQTKNSYVYGPVPSRRLGYSLGVDILPSKTCTLDCIYCQLGPNREKSTARKNFYPQEDILQEIRAAVESGQHIDHITFSGSGEPTLNAAIGPLIRDIKRITKIPVAVLTNSTLLSQKKVREALGAADVVVPSLDAATQKTFETVNRPHSSLKLDETIRGLKLFREEFKGKIWLEIMLVKGMNDSPSHIEQLKQIISQIKPDKVQLNSVVRPPAEDFARSLTPKELGTIRKAIGGKAEIIAEFGQKSRIPSHRNFKKKVMDMVQRRPVTMRDMADSLGCQEKDFSGYVEELVLEGKIKPVVHRGKTYFESN